MPKLPELQKNFIATLVQAEPVPATLPIAGDDRFSAEDRLQVYKNNTQFILRDLLLGLYPVTALLLGKDFMQGAARAFISAFPPASGDMNDYGGTFPAFLEHIQTLRSYAYVPDVARLEWAAHEAYLSSRLPPVTADDLAAIADPLNMKLFLQPHLRLLRSGWPVDTLWSRITDEGEKLTGLEIRPEETFIAVYRAETKIVVWSLTEGGYKFLEYLQLNPGFAFAAETALQAESSLRLDLLLAQLVQEKLLVKKD